METPKTFSDFLIWLTPERLSRLNHIRDRADAPALRKPAAARLLANLTEDARSQTIARIQ